MSNTSPINRPITIEQRIREIVREEVKEGIKHLLRDNDSFELPQSEHLTIEQAAQFLRCHPSTVRMWIKNGRLSTSRVGAAKHAKILISRASIEALVKDVQR